MTKSFDNIDWVCKLHDDLTHDAEVERVWLEKHYGHKPDVLKRKLTEHELVFTMAHEMLDHLHIKATQLQSVFNPIPLASVVV